VLEAAAEQLETAAGSAPKNGNAAEKEPFSRNELQAYLAKNGAQIVSVADDTRSAGVEFARRLKEISQSLGTLATLLDTPGTVDLEDLERRLTILDDKLQALLMSNANEETMLKIRREMDGQLAAYRRKMKAEQIALVEKQYLQKRLLEEYGLPRLSLYYFS
jgi:hypothetical protein